MSERRVVTTTGAPAAIGPYSQGVIVSGARTLYTSGQIALDPASGRLVEGGVEAEAEQVMKNLEAVLASAGMGFGDVVRATIYLQDLGDFATVNAIYGARFPHDPPSRACVQAAGLPKGARVEIDLVAVA